MAEVNLDNEIFEFAIAREVQANRFYLALAGRVKDPQIRKVFEDLAKEELEHKAKLELEIMKTGRTVTAGEKTPDLYNDGETAGGLAAGTELDMDYRDMLLLGMEKEDASFRTYINLIPQARDQASRDVLLAIAEEEVRHKIRFETEYDILSRQS